MSKQTTESYEHLLKNDFLSTWVYMSMTYDMIVVTSIEYIWTLISLILTFPSLVYCNLCLYTWASSVQYSFRNDSLLLSNQVASPATTNTTQMLIYTDSKHECLAFYEVSTVFSTFCSLLIVRYDVSMQ